MLRFKHIKPNQKGMTLMEIMVAVSLFALLTISVGQILQTIIDGQRSAIAAQNLGENMMYVFEVMSRELRMATLSAPPDNSCFKDQYGSFLDVEGIYYVYEGITDEGMPFKDLQFKNQYGNCVNYFLENDVLKVWRSDVGTSTAIMPDDLVIRNLDFIVNDHATTTKQRITMKMNIHNKGYASSYKNMTFQTSISTRYYD